jgi:tRNA threonylcarbamoyladenosine biosynthesis protein TsaB
VVVVGEVAEGVALPAGVRWARGAALDLPDAAWVGRLAVARLGEGTGGGGDEVEPLYVRAPDATPARSG